MKVVFSTWSVVTTTVRVVDWNPPAYYTGFVTKTLEFCRRGCGETCSSEKGPRARQAGRQAGELSGPPKTYLTDRTRDVIYMYLYVVV